MTFTDRPLRGILTGILTGAMALTITPLGDAGSADVIVRGTDLAAVTAAVLDHGGQVDLEIGIINAVSAHVPAGLVDALEADARVTDVTNDAPIELANRALSASHTGSTPTEAMAQIGGSALLKSSFDGDGVDVAVIDSGVREHKGLGSDRVERTIDLSLGDSRSRDGYGHGTVMASIIGYNAPKLGYVGVAPHAGIIDVKVADANGMADVSQVLAGIDWAVSNRNTDGRKIRVMSLSFGTDGTNSYDMSPLAYAVEAAWRHGIVVVVSAGNHGDALGRLTSPAIDPYVIAVGALDTNSTSVTSDDVVPSWSARGDGVRNPDIVVPGRSLWGAMSWNSAIADANPGAIDGDFIRGSGTSQAAAFTAGIVATMLEARPSLTPDQVKALLVTTARDLTNTPATKDGAGALDLAALYPGGKLAPTPKTAAQSHGWSTGDGSLDGDRGSFFLRDSSGNVLSGENTVVGTFDRAAWKGSTWSGSTWSGSTWSGSTWSGSTWSGSTWSGSTWSGSTWSGSTWSNAIWGD